MLLDLACIAKNTDVRSWMFWWQRAYPHADPTSFIVALGAVNEISVVPLEILPAYATIVPMATLNNALLEISKQL